MAKLGFLGDILGARTKGTTTVALTKEQKALTKQQVKIGEFQLAELERQRAVQDEAFGAVEPSASAFDRFVGEQTGDTAQLDAAQDELLQDMLNRIRAGGSATPEEIELINSATEQAIAAGESDITRFMKLGLEQLRDELAPQLGLRPGDTPILDRGGRVVAEGTRQQGQLVRDLRSQQFLSRLGFPLQRAQTLGTLNLGQQDLATARKEFLANLKLSAFVNRLNLAQRQTSAGLGLAGQGQPNVAPIFSSVGSVSKGVDASQGQLNMTQSFANVAGGVTSLGGLTTAGGFSSRALKNTQGPVDDEAILAALASIPVEKWTYKGEDKEHIGTFAEDFKEAFGVGDGQTINYLDAIGVLMAAVKALANRPAAALSEQGA